MGLKSMTCACQTFMTRAYICCTSPGVMRVHGPCTERDVLAADPVTMIDQLVVYHTFHTDDTNQLTYVSLRDNDMLDQEGPAN